MLNLDKKSYLFSFFRNIIENIFNTFSAYKQHFKSTKSDIFYKNFYKLSILKFSFLVLPPTYKSDKKC